MGKWMLEYHDDVLRDKFKSMVNASIKKTALEKGGPAITYEGFVTELEVGDSFTSSLIDVMVKELADRKTRPNPLDRHLISEHTAKALRMYGSRTRTYRERPSVSIGLTRTTTIDYSGPSADVDQLEEEEDMADSGETYHLGSMPALNDAFRREPMFYTEAEPLLSPPADEDQPFERVISPLPLSPPSRAWVPSTLLNRQNSMRRAAARSRTSDFYEFTTRRRSVQRANSDSLSGDALRTEESTDGTWRFPGRFSASSASAGPSNRPRFLPMAALVDPQYRTLPVVGEASGPEQRSLFTHNTYPHHYLSPPPLPSSSGSQTSTPSVPPRLRRGGMRAPEALLQHASNAISGAEPSTSEDAPATGRTSLASSSSSLQNAIERIEAARAEETTTQLLTPRSISPAEDNNA